MVSRGGKWHNRIDGDVNPGFEDGTWVDALQGASLSSISQLCGLGSSGGLVPIICLMIGGSSGFLDEEGTGQGVSNMDLYRVVC